MLNLFVCLYLCPLIVFVFVTASGWLKRLRNPAVAKCQTKAVEQINKLNDIIVRDDKVAISS